MSNSLLAALAIKRQQQRKKEDPLAAFHCVTPGQEALLRNCGLVEVLLRGGNLSGKTRGGAALGIALARGRRELDGIALPKVPTPNVGAVLSLDYKQQKGSVQNAYLEMLGDWPHRIGWLNRSLGYIGSIRVKPDGWPSDDPDTWSEIIFISQENPNAGVGYRLHWCHGDEPPVERVWREIRKAGYAGQPFVKYITATPLFAAQWLWMRKDFDGEQPGRLEVVATVYDNKALSRDEVARLERDYANDPLRNARLFGDYVDTAGASPFGRRGFEVLQEWKRNAVEPSLHKFRIQNERVGRDGILSVVTETVEAEVWELPKQGEKYYVIADPSTGVEDDRHDPAGLHVWARGARALVARYSGYIGAYGLGSLAAALARQYGGALIDVDNTGGYGGPFLTALRMAQYSNVNKHIRPDRPDRWQEEYGFKITTATRAEIIAAIQAALEDSAAGTPSAFVWSDEVCSCLLNVTIDAKGKILAVEGRHDEDMICMGRALHLMTTRPMAQRDEKTGLPLFDAILRKTRQVGAYTAGAWQRPKDRW